MALPWGANSSTEPAFQVDVTKELGLSPGSFIEVKWEIIDEDTNVNDSKTVTFKWWRALVREIDNTVCDGEGRHAYVLVYDKDESLGYDEEQRRVTFIDTNELYDIAEEDILEWRKEGDVRGDDCGDEGTIVDVRTLTTRLEKLERLKGRSVEEDLKLLLQSVPAEKQHLFAERWAAGAQMFSEEIRRKLQSMGPGDDVIRQSHVQEILENLQRRLEEIEPVL